MKVVKFNVEVKKSKNFQTYTCGEEVILEEGDDLETMRNQRIAICRKAVMDQIRLDIPK